LANNFLVINSPYYDNIIPLSSALRRKLNKLLQYKCPALRAGMKQVIQPKFNLYPIARTQKMHLLFWYLQIVYVK